MSKPKVICAAWLEPEIKGHVEKLASIQGVSISEYLRGLVIADLDSRSVFTGRLKESIREAATP